MCYHLLINIYIGIKFQPILSIINKMRGIIILLVLIATLALHTSAVNYRKVVHQFDPEAKCLDGSPGLLYVHEGGDPHKILIFMEGGGLCGE